MIHQSVLILRIIYGAVFLLFTFTFPALTKAQEVGYSCPDEPIGAPLYSSLSACQNSPCPSPCQLVDTTQGGNGSTSSTSGKFSAGGSSGGSTMLDNPLGQSDPRVIIGNIIRVVLGIVGSLALIIFIYGGLMWMTSSGNTERIKKGRDTLVWATIGLMVIFGSYTVVNFVIQSLARPPTP